MNDGYGRILSTPELAKSLCMPLYWAGYDMNICRFDCRVLPGAVRERMPDVLMLNALMAGLDVGTLAETIAALPIERMPAVVAFFPDNAYESMCLAAERGVICQRDMSRAADSVIALLGSLTLEDRLMPLWAGRKAVEYKMRLLGVNDQTAGFEYLCRAVMLCARDCRCFGRLSVEVYPAIARECGTNAAAVERLTRHAIESAWLHGNIDVQYSFFGNTVDASKGKPTNSEFIARITEALRLEAKT